MASFMDMYTNSSLSGSSTPSATVDGSTSMAVNSSDNVQPSPFPIMSPELRIVNYTIGIVGIVDNTFVIIVILASRVLRKELNMMFILHQSIIDLTVAFLLLATTCIRGYEIQDGLLLGGEVYCRLWLNKLPLWGMLTVSTYNLLALSVERYMSMIHPIWHRMSFNPNKAAFMMIFCWIFGLAYNAAYMIPTSFVDGNYCRIYANWPAIWIRDAVGVLNIFILFLFPLAILSFCYGRIVLMLKKRVTLRVVFRDASAAGSSSRCTARLVREDRWSKAHRNAIYTLTIVSCCFTLCWVWNQVYFLEMNLGYPPDYTSNFYHFTVIAIFLNCCINPIIYSLKYEQFQSEAKRLLCSRKPNRTILPTIS